MNLEGRLIGNRYEIIEKIGTGGMATVYKARCTILNRYVAVKVLREEFTTDEEFIKRFNSEAQSAASLTHPNIVSVYDVGQEYNIYYIVMELVKGKTLKELINEEGTLPWKWSLNIAMQIASALEMAHKNNIIHRDIKPHNIIITEDGVAKVTDFGIAKAVSNSTITAFGTTIGSVHYFSPEHARGGYTDAKSDLYSLGVVMYEMLTGKVPFDADTPVSIALKHMQEKPIEPMVLNTKIPLKINQIIMKAMEKDTTLRYSSATEMLKDMSLALKNPEGSFEKNVNVEANYTRVIPTIKTEIPEKRIEDKKKGKMAMFFEKHPAMKVLVIPISIIFLFVLTLLVTLIILNTSKAKNVILPNLVGLTLEEAQNKLKEVNLQSQIEEKYDFEIEAGKIISQDPKYINNYNVLEGSNVKIVVSKGSKVVTMPKVIGKKYEEATKELEDLELKVEKVDSTSKTVEEGYVISQSVDANKETSAGETIKLTVSTGTGIPKVVVTYVIGKDEETAKTELTGLGLEVNIIETEDKTKTDGSILKQSISEGTVVEEGTKITLTVNRIAKIKQGTVNVNVKALTGYTTGDEVKDVEIMIKNGSNDILCNENVASNTENLSVTVEGLAVTQIKVYVDSVLKKTSRIDLTKEGSICNIE